MLSKEELLHGLKKTNIFVSEKELETLISKIDINKNGSIDYSEFIALTIDKKKALN